jgi:hypothetical protein
MQAQNKNKRKIRKKENKQTTPLATTPMGGAPTKKMRE